MGLNWLVPCTGHFQLHFAICAFINNFELLLELTEKSFNSLLLPSI